MAPDTVGVRHAAETHKVLFIYRNILCCRLSRIRGIPACGFTAQITLTFTIPHYSGEETQKRKKPLPASFARKNAKNGGLCPSFLCLRYVNYTAAPRR